IELLCPVGYFPYNLYSFVDIHHSLYGYGHLYIFFSYTATTEIYTLSLHDALPISIENSSTRPRRCLSSGMWPTPASSICRAFALDRKSTRLNSSHVSISYAVLCLKKKRLEPFFYIRFH